MKAILIYWTAANVTEAKEISHALVESKLVACANIIPQIESIFLWKGKIETASEVKVLFKTRESLFQNVLQTIVQKSSYEVPEVLQVPILDGNPAYLRWLEESTSHL